MKSTLSTLSLLIFTATLFLPAISEGMTENHAMHNKTASTEAGQKKTLDSIYEHDLGMLSKAVSNAIQLLQNGDSKAALAELQRIKTTTEGFRQALAAHVTKSFVNNRCPIMNSPIQPDRVKENLVREFQGQKVAFCCGGCPSAWDQLSDSQKQQKLSKVLVQSHQAH